MRLASTGLLIFWTLLPACKVDDGGTTGDSTAADTGSDTGTGPGATTSGTTTGKATDDPTTEPGTAGSSASTVDPTSTTDPPGGTDPATTTEASGGTEPVDTTTTGLDTSGDSTGLTLGTGLDSSTGLPGLCGALNAMECMATPTCLAVLGGKVNTAKMCSQKPMFLGCIDATGCGDAITYACDPAIDPPQPYEFKDTCIPDGWEVCDAPGVDGPC